MCGIVYVNFTIKKKMPKSVNSILSFWNSHYGIQQCVVGNKISYEGAFFGLTSGNLFKTKLNLFEKIKLM